MTLSLSFDDCPDCLVLPAIAFATGRSATCATCDAEYLPPPPSASPAPVRAAERPRPAPTPEATPERPQRPASAPRDLDALARVLPVLTGSASPLVRIPGGQSEGSPAERVQGLLEAALRAASRLAWLRQTHPREALALLATHVHAGPELRAASDWPESLELALRPRAERVAALASAARAGAGPRAHGAKAEGIALLARAEALYATAEEQLSDGRWLEEDLDTVSRGFKELVEDRFAVASARCRAPKRGRLARAGAATVPPACVEVPRPEQELCSGERRGGLVNAAEWLGASCTGRKSRRTCRVAGTWKEAEGALVPAPPSTRRKLGRLHPEPTWGLLVAAAEGR